MKSHTVSTAKAYHPASAALGEAGSGTNTHRTQSASPNVQHTRPASSKAQAGRAVGPSPSVGGPHRDNTGDGQRQPGTIDDDALRPP
jgi:hypothetical protein